MKLVQLDYIGPKPIHKRLVGMMVFCMALALSAFLAYRHAELSEKLEAQQARLEKSERHARVNNQNYTPAITSTLRSEVEQGNQVIRQIALPWDELFSTIESIPHDYVAVLSIQPDAEGGSVTIAAEAESAVDITEYIEAINESGVLKDAHLINHQVKTQDPQKPVGFTVTATWIGLRRR